MENAPPQVGPAGREPLGQPVCAYCGEDEGQEMILALWMSGNMVDPPKWFHIPCIIKEVYHWRDEGAAAERSYPH